MCRRATLSSMRPPEADASALAELQAALRNRPVWVAASTHPGEEAMIAECHQALRAMHPDLCAFSYRDIPDAVQKLPNYWHVMWEHRRAAMQAHYRVQRMRFTLAIHWAKWDCTFGWGTLVFMGVAGAAWRPKPSGSCAPRQCNFNRPSHRQFQRGL